MRSYPAMRALRAAKAAGGIAVFALGAASAADFNTGVFQDGKAGFVVSHIAYALSKDASETGACPNGMTKGNTELFSSSPEGHRHEGESDQDYGRRVAQGAQALGVAANGQNLCLNPEAGAPDPNFRTVTGKDVPADGIDLDGQDSHLNGNAAPGMCPHDDLLIDLHAISHQGDPCVCGRYAYTERQRGFG